MPAESDAQIQHHDSTTVTVDDRTYYGPWTVLMGIALGLLLGLAVGLLLGGMFL